MTQKAPENSRFENLIAINLASGSTIKAAGKDAGCSESIAYAISRTPRFRAKVSAYRAEAIQLTVGILSAAMTTAADVLIELMGDDDPRIRPSAASKLLSSIMPLSELHELRQDVKELKDQLAKDQPTETISRKMAG